MTVETIGQNAPNILVRLWDGAVRLTEAIAEGRAAEQRYHRLSRMSDAELASRGLTRADLPAEAFKHLG